MGTEPGDPAIQPTEASFVLDDRRRIVEWSHAATITLDVPEEAALGRQCYEVVRGQDPFGKKVCGPDCPALKSLQSGQLTAHCSLRLSSQGKRRKPFLAKLVALPKVPGGALVTLVERGPPAQLAPNGDLASPSFSKSSATDILHDLATLTTLSTSLSPDRLEESIDQGLEWLRQATDADAAELFLEEPRGGDMLLTAYSGPFRNAFAQITRFPPGEGFPGIVQSSGQPIATRSLADDPRYLRTQVKEKGFHSYVCVPLLGPGGVIGVLNVAARRADLDLPRTLRLLTWASHPMSNVLQAGLLQNRLAITVGSAEISADVERDFDGLLRAVLHQMMLIGNATGAALAVYDSSGRGLVRRVKDGEFAGVVCPDAKAQDPQMCPALVSGNGMALYGSRNRWSLHCRQVPAKGGLVYCLPLVAEGDKIGTVQLGYAGRVPSPPTRYVAALLNAAEQAAPVVRQAWKNLQYQKRALRLRSTWRQETSRDLAHAERSIERPPQATDISDVAPAPPFLEVRCFGGFELYRQGKLVTPEVFQRRGAITIFQILLTHDGRPVTRDALTEILWPEADPQSAVKRLHVLVHALRRVVEPAPQDRRWTFICNDGDRYYFNAEAPYRLDVKEFRECISLGERLERRGDVAAAIDAYEVAADQYRGDFLEDEPYAEWCWEEREALRETHLDALRRLAGLYTNQNAPELSAESYRRALKADPLREENHQGLMRTLWAAGRRSEALRQYQMCKELLRRELEVDPLPETTELYHLIRDNGER